MDPQRVGSHPPSALMRNSLSGQGTEHVHGQDRLPAHPQVETKKRKLSPNPPTHHGACAVHEDADVNPPADALELLKLCGVLLPLRVQPRLQVPPQRLQPNGAWGQVRTVWTGAWE